MSNRLIRITAALGAQVENDENHNAGDAKNGRHSGKRNEKPSCWRVCCFATVNFRLIVRRRTVPNRRVERWRLRNTVFVVRILAHSFAQRTFTVQKGRTKYRRNGCVFSVVTIAAAWHRFALRHRNYQQDQNDHLLLALQQKNFFTVSLFLQRAVCRVRPLLDRIG